MASYTTNLNLKKPAGSENVAIGDINNNMDLIDSAYGTLNSNLPVVLLNQTSESHKIFFTKNKNIYHFHYERYTKANNGTLVTTINQSYAPTNATAEGVCYFMQNSGYGKVKCGVRTNGEVILTALDYNEQVAGIFDVYWTKE